MTESSLRETQLFFGTRAAAWEDRFPDDTPKFQAAIDQMELKPGTTVLDVGCGTGRALPLLRETVGGEGVVVGLDATPEMLDEALRLGRKTAAHLLLGNAEQLPLPSHSVDAVFAAGLVPHLSAPATGFAELARVTRTGGRLAIFHPIGRAALAARHGGVPSDDDVTAPARLGQLLTETGWSMESFDDTPDWYLAVATRV